MCVHTVVHTHMHIQIHTHTLQAPLKQHTKALTSICIDSQAHIKPMRSPSRLYIELKQNFKRHMRPEKGQCVDKDTDRLGATVMQHHAPLNTCTRMDGKKGSGASHGQRKESLERGQCVEDSTCSQAHIKPLRSPSRLYIELKLKHMRPEKRQCVENSTCTVASIQDRNINAKRAYLGPHKGILDLPNGVRVTRGQDVCLRCVLVGYVCLPWFVFVFVCVCVNVWVCVCTSQLRPGCIS
jgi:hypothetical protein